MLIRHSDIEGAVCSMTNGMLDVDSKVAGFETSIQHPVRAQNVPTPGEPIQGVPKNISDEERIIEVDPALQGELRIRL